MIHIPSNSYYGSYRTRTFADIFSSFDEFELAYNEVGLTIDFNAEYLTLKQLYLMLYAHYGNSHIAYSDENQFKYYLFSILFQHGPRALKKREIQIEMTKLTQEEILSGGKTIYNHSFNPSTAPSTSTIEELLTINDQNTANYRKSKLTGLATLNEALSRDVIDDFIHKFKKLFIKVLAPDYPLLYETEVDD